MTKKELLSVPKREWDKPLHSVRGVYVIPSGRKHDSGYSCMDFVAEIGRGEETKLIRFGGSCDDVSLAGRNFRMDCMYPSRIIHIWNTRNTFTVSDDLSSITFKEEEYK